MYKYRQKELPNTTCTKVTGAYQQQCQINSKNFSQITLAQPQIKHQAPGIH